MFGSNILEVAVGVVFVYLLLSLICAVINEGIASIINQRGKILIAGIQNLLNDGALSGLAQQLYNHGLVVGISPGCDNGWRRPPRSLYSAGARARLITESSLKCRVSYEMVVVARGEPGTPLSWSALTVSGYQTKKNHAGRSEEASILREFIRFISGAHRRTETPVGARIAYWHFLIEGAMRSAQNKKAPYKDKSRYELRHPTSERGSLIRILPGARARTAEARK